MAAKREITVRRSTLAEQGTENDWDSLTPGERMGLIEQLNIDAWAMKGEDIRGQRMRKDVVRVFKRKPLT